MGHFVLWWTVVAHDGAPIVDGTLSPTDTEHILQLPSARILTVLETNGYVGGME